MRGPLLAAAAAAALALPAAASGAAVSVTPVGAVAGEVPYGVAVSGSADAPGLLGVELGPAAAGCDGVTGDLLDSRHVEPGPFAFTLPSTTQDPGAYVLCAHLRDFEHAEDVAAAAAPFSLRPPVVHLTVSAPAVAALGHAVPVAIGGDAEAQRDVESRLAPPGLSCENALRTVGLPGAGLQVDALAVHLAESVPLTRYGTWHVCARARRSLAYLDPASDVNASRPIRVTVRCTRAARARSRAQDAWRAISRRERLAGRPASAEARRRGRALRRAQAAERRGCPGGAAAAGRVML